MRDLALTKLHSVIQFLEINTEDIPQEKTRILKIGALLVNAKYWGESWLKTQHSKDEDHEIQSQHFMANRWGNNGNKYFILGGGPKSL